MSEPAFFQILDTTRAMKRLKPDPVPPELLPKVLDAGPAAPRGANPPPGGVLGDSGAGAPLWLRWPSPCGSPPVEEMRTMAR